MHENTEIKTIITLGNIPLTVAQDAPQIGYPAQLPGQNYPANEQLQTNSIQTIGFIAPAPVPGFAQQVPPYSPPPPFTSAYPQQLVSPVPTAANTFPVQPGLYPQTQEYSQSQLPYPDVNIQQPAFNPSYQNMNPEVISGAPTAPSL